VMYSDSLNLILDLCVSLHHPSLFLNFYFSSMPSLSYQPYFSDREV
jgi:hypothetical protein